MAKTETKNTTDAKSEKKKPVKRGVDSSTVRFSGALDKIEMPKGKPITLKVVVSTSSAIDLPTLRRIQGETSRIEIRPNQVDAFNDAEKRADAEEPKSTARMPFVLRYVQLKDDAHIVESGQDSLPDTLVGRKVLCGLTVEAQCKDKPGRGVTVCPKCKKAAKKKGA